MKNPLKVISTSVFAVLSCFLPSQVIAKQLDIPGARAKQWVQFRGPDSITVEANKPVTVELHFEVTAGFHINSHHPNSDLLIPTKLALVEDASIVPRSADFPAGEPYTLSVDPNTKLDVYSGEFVVKAHLLVRPGTHPLAGQLHYQACDKAACYPPQTLTFKVNVTAK
jgi:hypothetical protein